MMLESHRTFRKELRRLSELYDLTMHSYFDVSETIRNRIKSGTLSPNQHLPSNFGFVKGHRADRVGGLLKVYYPNLFAVQILIRLVSLFEVFLTRLLLEASERRDQPIQANKTLEKVHLNELFSLTSLNAYKRKLDSADARSLTSKGFDEMCKYYLKHLDIVLVPANLRTDDGQMVSIDDVREIHARRHLHVHAAGKVDAQYRREFGESHELGTVALVDDAYLSKAIQVLQKCADHVASEVDIKCPETLRIQIEGVGFEILKSDWIYSVSLRLESHGAAIAEIRSVPPNILVGGEAFGSCARFVVAGSKDLVGNYIGKMTIKHKDNSKSEFLAIRTRRSIG